MNYVSKCAGFVGIERKMLALPGEEFLSWTKNSRLSLIGNKALPAIVKILAAGKSDREKEIF